MRRILLMSSAAVLVCAAAAADWPTYNNGYDSQRYSPLDQINTANVGRLRRVCDLTLGENASFQTGPLVIGNVMYLTTPHTTVAMDAATCKVLWRNVAPAVAPKSKMAGQAAAILANRGVAYLDGRLFRGMPDGSLAAFNAKSGNILWQVPAGDPQKAEYITSAPIAWHNMVFAGMAIGDFQTLRGRVRAWDAATGQLMWQFHTIPMGNEPGAGTWIPPSSAQAGGGGQWTSYTLDTKRGELFVAVGNPAPDFMPQVRNGMNLYTDSVVVLDAATGQLKWWFQATAHDAYDHDIGATPVLYTTRGGAARMAVGSKNGYVYGIDRTTHAPVFKTAVTTIFNEGAPVTTAGVCICPGALGGVEWNGPAFDPQSHALVAGAVDRCMTYIVGGMGVQGQCLGPKSAGSSMSTGWVTALDADSGAVLWKLATPAPVVAGVTPTAGGLVFTDDLNGTLYAIDKKSGAAKLKLATGGPIAGGVITYSVGGRQYVATTSGNISRTFTPPPSPSPAPPSPPARIVVLALDVPKGGPRSVSLPLIGPPPPAPPPYP